MERSAPTRKARAEIFIEKQKVIFLNAAILLLIIGGVWATSYYIEKVELLIIVALTALYIYFQMTFKSWRLLFKSPHARLYETGIEISGLGFWEWKDFVVHQDGDLLTVFVSEQDQAAFIKKLKKVPVETYEQRQEKGGIGVVLKFPELYANMSVEAFYKTIYRYAPADRKAKTSAAPANITWRTHLFGKEDFGAREVLMNITILVACVLMIYPIFDRGFFPSKDWIEVHQPLIVGIIILSSLWYYWAYYKGKVKMNNVSTKFGRAALLLFLPAFIFIMTYPAIALSLGGIYTRTLGVPTEKSVKIDGFKTRKGKYCIESQELGTGLFRDLCPKLNPVERLRISDKSTLYLKGKQSWFGFRMDGIEKIEF